MVLSDWERVFDEVIRPEMFTAMERMGIDTTLIKPNKNYIQKHNIQSRNRRQHIGLARTTHRNQTRLSTITIPISNSDDSHV